MEFHALVKKRMAELGWKPSELGRQADIKYSTLKNIVDGSNPSYGNLLKIMLTLGLSFTDDTYRDKQNLPPNVVDALAKAVDVLADSSKSPPPETGPSSE